MFMIFVLIEIKFDIDINNDELLIIIWEHNKKAKLSLVVCSNVKPKFIYFKKLHFQLQYNIKKYFWVAL